MIKKSVLKSGVFDQYNISSINEVSPDNQCFVNINSENYRYAETDKKIHQS